MYPEILSIIFTILIILFLVFPVVHHEYIKWKYTLYISNEKYHKLSSKDKLKAPFQLKAGIAVSKRQLLKYKPVICLICEEYILPKRYYYNPKLPQEYNIIQHVCSRRECRLEFND